MGKLTPHLHPSGLVCPETIFPLFLSNALIQSLNWKSPALFNICALMHIYNWKIAKPFVKQYLIIWQGTLKNVGFLLDVTGGCSNWSAGDRIHAPRKRKLCSGQTITLTWCAMNSEKIVFLSCSLYTPYSSVAFTVVRKGPLLPPWKL